MDGAHIWTNSTRRLQSQQFSLWHCLYFGFPRSRAQDSVTPSLVTYWGGALQGRWLGRKGCWIKEWSQVRSRIGPIHEGEGMGGQMAFTSALKGQIFWIPGSVRHEMWLSLVVVRGLWPELPRWHVLDQLRVILLRRGSCELWAANAQSRRAWASCPGGEGWVEHQGIACSHLSCVPSLLFLGIWAHLFSLFGTCFSLFFIFQINLTYLRHHFPQEAFVNTSRLVETPVFPETPHSILLPTTWSPVPALNAALGGAEPICLMMFSSRHLEPFLTLNQCLLSTGNHDTLLEPLNLEKVKIQSLIELSQVCPDTLGSPTGCWTFMTFSTVSMMGNLGVFRKKVEPMLSSSWFPLNCWAQWIS